MITSFGNRSVKEVVQLNQKAKARNTQDVFAAEGVKMFAEAPEERIRKVYLAERVQKQMYDEYREKLDRLSVEIVADDVFDRMSDTKSPQGILCLVRQFHYSLEEILQRTHPGEKPLLMLLEDIQDPGNLGTIFRTGEGAGADGIIMSGRTADIYNPKTIRSTMGSIYRVPFVYTDDLRGTVRLLKQRGIAVYAAHLEGAEDYDRCDYRGGTAFLAGNEANGLTAETADCADHKIRVPMEGKVESLNVSVASSILLYEAYRQRRDVRRNG